jgi:hypothetical protein
MLLLAAAPLVFSDTYVNSYTRSDGTFVQGHMRSSPDGNPYNNYSTQGNVNPYTGQVGTHSPYEGTYQNGNGLGGSNGLNGGLDSSGNSGGSHRW